MNTFNIYIIYMYIIQTVIILWDLLNKFNRACIIRYIIKKVLKHCRFLNVAYLQIYCDSSLTRWWALRKISFSKMSYCKTFITLSLFVQFSGNAFLVHCCIFLRHRKWWNVEIMVKWSIMRWYFFKVWPDGFWWGIQY